MSTDLTLLAGQPAQLPAAIQQAMAQQTVDEMQSNVGQSFAVVGIKGKNFSIKYGGNVTPLTMTIQGQVYAAPYFDVVLVKAKAELSKTYYKSGYQDGSDAAPDCWSEDGKTPLGPEATRPLFDEMAGPNAGKPCTDCALCPMNRFGSKIGQGAGQGEARQGKACADTRKVVVLPLKPTGAVNQDGSPVTVLDAENIKFGGAMLLRVPAASLKVFAEYSSKLQAAGVPYYGVVTRMMFDSSEAYPKFQLQPTRYLSEAEANEMINVRDGGQVTQILESGMVGAVPAAAAPALPPAGQLASALAPPPAPPAQHMTGAAPVPPAAPTATVVPLHPTAPTPMAPPGAPLPPAAPPAAPPVAPAPAPVAAAPVDPEEAAAAAVGIRMLPAAQFKYSQYKSADWTPQQIVDNGFAVWLNAPASAPVQAAPLAPPPATVLPQAPAPVGGAPLQASPDLISRVDSLLAS